MKQCWAESPEDRPTFSDLVENVSEYTEKIAGYLDINLYNPFTATYEEIGSPEDEKIVANLDQVVQGLKNKNNQLRSTPCNSAQNSPFVSPFHTPRGSPRASRMTSPVLPDSRPQQVDPPLFTSLQKRVGVFNSQNKGQSQTGMRRLSVDNSPCNPTFYTPQRRLSESTAIQIKITDLEST